MKIVNSHIEFTDEEIQYFNRTNPTIFDIAIMVNKQLPGTFGRNGVEAKPGDKLWDGRPRNISDLPVFNRCPFNAITFLYKDKPFCDSHTCSMTLGDKCPSCFELTWLEIRGKIPVIDRWHMDFESRKRLMLKHGHRSIKVV